MNIGKELGKDFALITSQSFVNRFEGYLHISVVTEICRYLNDNLRWKIYPRLYGFQLQSTNQLVE